MKFNLQHQAVLWGSNEHVVSPSDVNTVVEDIANAREEPAIRIGPLQHHSQRYALQGRAVITYLRLGHPFIHAKAPVLVRKAHTNEAAGTHLRQPCAQHAIAGLDHLWEEQYTRRRHDCTAH